MNHEHDDRLDTLLDGALEDLRRTEADEATVRAAAERSRARLLEALAERESARVESTKIRSCDDWQRLIPSYLEGTLSDARRLLFEDHTRECVPCRRALKQARGAGADAARARRPVAAARRRPGWRRDWSWMAAAAAILAFALLGVGVRFGGFGLSGGGLVRVEAVDGTLMRIADLLTTPAIAGEAVDTGEPLRTARDSGAVMTLEDGTRIEMNERSELSVRRSGKDRTIVLERGDIIVQAAKQPEGKLYVETGDCEVEVTGTVFTVSAGTKGSRVSVLEGQVVVEDDRGRHVLSTGQQFTSSAAILPVPMAHDVAWSRNADHWLAVAQEIEAFQAELDARIGDTRRRFSSPLLDRVPEDTVLYVAVPNLTDVVTEAHALMLEKVGSSATFRTWWDDHVAATGADARIDEAIGIVGRLGNALGEEIVVTLQPSADGRDVRGPVVLAQVVDADAARAEIDALLSGVAEAHGEPDLVRVDSLAAVGAPAGGARVFVGDDLLVLAANGGTLPGSATGFRATAFGRRLSGSYDDGVGLLVGADLHALVGSRVGGSDPAARVLGLDNLRHVIVERSDLGNVNLTRATLSVDGERQGVLSWLAEPAPMGTLEFVSPDALAVSSFAIRRPATVIEDLLARMGQDADEARAAMDEFRENTGVDLMEDIAAVLGGEFTVALDGPVLPKPAWKVVVEVYDPTALQRTLQWAVDQINTYEAAADRTVRLTSTKRRGRTYWAVESDALGTVAHYTFVDGYWLIASQDAMIDRALQYRASGVTLAASRKFLGSLPEDAQDNVSAVLYQDFGRLIGALADGPVGGSMTEEQREAMRSLGSTEGPMAVVAYGHPDRIEIVGTDRGSFLFGNQLSRLFNVGTLFDAPSMHSIEPGGAGSGYDGPPASGSDPSSAS